MDRKKYSISEFGNKGWVKLVDTIVGPIAEQIEKQGHRRAIETLIGRLNVGYRYECNGDIQDLRTRLNKESGIIISNHPDFVDIPAILNALELETFKRLKVIVNSLFVDVLRKHLGSLVDSKELFLSYRGRGGSEFVELSHQIAEHIERGGLFLIFPTGGKERHSGRFVFKNLFPELLRRIDKDNMVYSFCVEPNDVAEFVKRSGKLRLIGGIASIPFLSREKNAVYRHTKERQSIVRVEERYTRAEIWQENIRCVENGSLSVSKELRRSEVNFALTQVYLEMFGRDITDFQRKY